MFIIIFAGFFLLSLVSHGTIINVIGAFFIIAICFFKGCFFKLNKKHVCILIILMLFVFFHAFFFSLEMGVKVAQASSDSLLNNLIMSFILLFLAFSVMFLIRNELDVVIRSLFWVLIVNLIFFIIQFFTVYMSDFYIDAVYFFTGEESRYQNYFLQGAASSFVKYRVTGFYIEPSTYVAVLCTLSTAYRVITKNIGLYIAVIITCLMTFSTISFIVAFLMGLSLLRKEVVLRFILIVSFVSILMITVFNDFFIIVANDFFLKLSMTSGERIDLIRMIYYLDGNVNFIGYGLFSIPEEIYILASSDSGQYRIASINDAGLINFIGMKFGILGVFIVVLFMLIRFDYQKLMMFSSILMTKISFMFPIFIVVLVPFLLNKKYEIYERTFR